MRDASALDGAELPDDTRSPRPAKASPPRWLLFARGVAFVAIVAFFFSGLAYRQLGESKNRYLPAWMMFGGAGVKRSQVEYWIEHEDGSREVVDPYQVLELERSKKSPSVFRVHGRAEAHRLGLRLCRELGRGTDLRMKVRTAQRKRWKIEARGKQNLCTTPPKQTTKGKRRKHKKNTKTKPAKGNQG